MKILLLEIAYLPDLLLICIDGSSGRETTAKVVGSLAVESDDPCPELFSLSLMRLWRAIGLGIVIIVLQQLTPIIFEGLQATLLKFFEAAGRIFDASQAVINRAGL